MKKLNALFLICLFSILMSNTATAQTSFSHSVGLSSYNSTQGSGVAGLYSPRINFLELGDEMTLSIGSHLGFGFAISIGSSNSGSSLVLDIPLVVELNIGHASSPNTRSNFGGFVGAGFGFSMLAGSGSTGTDNFGNPTNTVYGNNVSLGPILNVGLRTNIIREIPIGLRVSYLLNVLDDGSNVVGVGVFYTFGFKNSNNSYRRRRR